MVAKSAADVSARMNKVGDAVRTAQTKSVKLAGDTLKRTVDGATPRRLRNVGRNGAALSVRVKTTGGSVPTCTGTAVGPWGIIEYPIESHLIGIGKASNGRGVGRKRARVRVVGGEARGGYLKGAGYEHGVRGPVVHPGTRGKLVFHKGVAAGTPRAVAVMRTTNLTAVREAFG